MPHASVNVEVAVTTCKKIEPVILAFPAWVAVNKACQTPCATNVTGPMRANGYVVHNSGGGVS